VKKELEENGHYVKCRKKNKTTESNIIKRKNTKGSKQKKSDDIKGE
jgi:hypothetical protein